MVTELSDWASLRSASTTCPLDVNFTALPPKLMSTCCSRMASPRTTAGRDVSRSKSTSIFLLFTLADSTTERLRSKVSKRKGSLSSVIFPASTLEKSRMSLSKPNSDCAAPSVLLA